MITLLLEAVEETNSFISTALSSFKGKSLSKIQPENRNQGSCSNNEELTADC